MSITTKHKKQFTSPPIVKTQEILKGQLFTVSAVTMRFPSGNKTHEVVYRRPTVTVFPVTDDNKLYLVRQYRYIHKQVTTEAMAGFVDKEELPLAAAKRELLEETGLTARKWSQLTSFELAGSVIKGTNYLFLARDLTLGQSQPEEDEDIELIQVPLSKALSMVLQGKINHAASMMGILLLTQKLYNKKI